MKKEKKTRIRKGNKVHRYHSSIGNTIVFRIRKETGEVLREMMDIEKINTERDLNWKN